MGDGERGRPGPDETAEVLRAVWSARGQGDADLADSFGPARSCKTMQDVGFDGLADTDADGDLRSAWRATLERDGKLSGTGSLRDLVLGQSGQARSGQAQSEQAR